MSSVQNAFKRIAAVLILVLSVPSLRLLKTIAVENDLHRTSPNVEHTVICRTRKGQETQANGDFCHLFYAWFRLPVKGTYTRFAFQSNFIFTLLMFRMVNMGTF